MGKKLKLGIIVVLLSILAIGSLYIYFRYFFTYGQRNVIRRKIGSITGMNMTVTVFSYDGRIIKRWKNVEKITTGVGKGEAGELRYTYFYTKENKYVQIPDSVWYLAEEE